MCPVLVYMQYVTTESVSRVVKMRGKKKQGIVCIFAGVRNQFHAVVCDLAQLSRNHWSDIF